MPATDSGRYCKRFRASEPQNRRRKTNCDGGRFLLYGIFLENGVVVLDLQLLEAFH